MTKTKSKYTVGFQFPSEDGSLTYPSKEGAEFPWTHNIEEAKEFTKKKAEDFAREKCGKYGYRLIFTSMIVEHQD